VAKTGCLFHSVLEPPKGRHIGCGLLDSMCTIVICLGLNAASGSNSSQ
jgi:hypothetical protein